MQSLKCLLHAQGTVTSLPLPDGNLGLPLTGETLQLLIQGDTFGCDPHIWTNSGMWLAP